LVLLTLLLVILLTISLLILLVPLLVILLTILFLILLIPLLVILLIALLLVLLILLLVILLIALLLVLLTLLLVILLTILLLILLILLLVILLIALLLVLLTLLLVILLTILLLVLLILLLVILLIVLLLVLLILLLIILLIVLLRVLALLRFLFLLLPQGQFQVVFGIHVSRIRAQRLFVGLYGRLKLLGVVESIAQVIEAVLGQIALSIEQGSLELPLTLLVVFLAVVDVTRVVDRLGRIRQVGLSVQIGGQGRFVILVSKCLVAIVVHSLCRTTTSGQGQGDEEKNNWK
jgi:hypothetical protein